ncbi:MAG: acyltransferase [Leptolyngbyaceae cyanobacterium RU_5_1]|nr:acyltransferase [Leptolyngbyaceae cyanobacterium RU_5_1]
MSISKDSSFRGWLDTKEAFVTRLTKSIPKKPGILLRQFFYRQILAQMGKSVLIEKAVEMLGTHHIELGNNVVIRYNSVLNASKSASRIVIRNNVCLQPHVCVCSRENGRIVFATGVIVGWGATIATCGDGHIEIGENTYIGAKSCLMGPGPIKIGKNCMIAHYSRINANHYTLKELAEQFGVQEPMSRGIVIEDNCWLDTGVKVLDGVTIGEGSVVSAGAVVTKDIPPWSVAVGMPAEVICSLQG